MEALSGVARSFLQDVDLGGGAPHAAADMAANEAAAGPGGLEGVVQTCVEIHRSVEARSKRYYEELQR